MNIQYNSNLPIYIQIMNLLKKEIVAGKLKKGEKLPSVRELSVKLQVNPNTIQRTYKELEREKLVFTQRGIGTFISEDKKMIQKLKQDMALKVIEEFFVQMINLGFTNKDILEIVSNRVKKEE